VIERERKFLVASTPDDIGPPTRLHQGYLALDGDVSARVRRSGDDAVLTVKGGSGRDRTEVELDLDGDQADALWPLTEGRRLEKDRHRVDLGGGLTAELDVYAEDLDGLRVVEVEFGEDQDPDAFEPPAWFGDELTDDPRWSNAALATDGPPA
jgi:adenylate cyclase